MARFRFAPAAPEEEIVFGSCAPDWGTRGTEPVDEWIEFVRDRDVRRALCLLSDGQVADRPDLLETYRAAFGPDRVRHVPIPDHHLPDPARLESALSFLQASEHRGERVVVHCLAGIGRTGVVLAGWLVARHDYDPREAVETVRATGRRPTDAVRSGNATESDLYDLLRAVG
ncbi:protein phosphatase [Halobacteriales archaeon QS_8_69_26]|nr:MAG: protein phosphatase [Halobacteriales archaeon QS_8_69_26]